MTRALVFRLGLLVLLIAPRAATQSPDILGPHNVNGQGCQSCHMPHSGAATDAAADPANGARSLWGRGFLATSYTLYDGSVLTTPSSYTASDPLFHSAACLSCHDGAVAVAGMTGRTVEGGGGASTFVAADASSLANDHPVHVPYECGGEHWPCTVEANGRVRFSTADPGTVHFSNTYGRPMRFYGTPDMRGVAYVECSTCHNPHAVNRARYQINGVTVMKPTRFFLRGWYEPDNPASNSLLQFCRSCHYQQSNEYVGLTSPAN